jgi:hypothetical protein
MDPYDWEIAVAKYGEPDATGLDMVAFSLLLTNFTDNSLADPG